MVVPKTYYPKKSDCVANITMIKYDLCAYCTILEVATASHSASHQTTLHGTSGQGLTSVTQSVLAYVAQASPDAYSSCMDIWGYSLDVDFWESRA